MAAWTAIVGLAVYANLDAIRTFVVEQARVEARGVYRRNLAIHQWFARTGGVYAPSTAADRQESRPGAVPGREVRTPSGQLLARMNPASMSRQVFGAGRLRDDTIVRAIGLHPAHPQNAPDRWETEALRALDRGEEEISSIDGVGEQARLRMVRPIPEEEGCRNCHGGTRAGADGGRGGISVSVPLAPIDARERNERRTGVLAYVALWLCGLAGIGCGGSKVQKYLDGRDKAERDLRESEDRYRDLVNHSHSLICTHDLSGKILSANPWAATVLGYSPEELLRMNLSDILAPAVRAEFPLYLKAIREFGAANGQLRVRTRWGDERVWEYHNTLRTSGVPEPRVRGLAHDITDLKRAEVALRDSTRRLQLAANAGHWGVWEWELRADRLIWDERMHELYGVSRDERPEGVGWWEERLLPGDRSVFREYLQSAIGSVTPLEVEFRTVRADGKVKWFQAHAIVVRDSDGSATRLIGLNSDITEHRNLKDQLRQSQKMEAIGRLAGGIAHDFNNLVTVVAGYGELLLSRRSPDDPERQEIEEIVKAGNRTAQLTRQLLAFSRKQILEPRVVCLDDVASGIERMLRRLVGENIDLILTPAEDLWSVRVDPSQVEQVLMNLAVNSRDAMPGGGSLAVSTANVVLDEAFLKANKGAVPGPHVVLSVRDTGCGMDDETISHIFEPFFTTKEAGKGTGLGLATVYGIVKQSGGYIEVESAVGRGTTFRVYFPRCDTTAADAPAPALSKARVTGSETILVVEDEKAVRKVVSRALEGKGYTVLAAADGDQAFRVSAAHRGAIDLLITDMVLPGIGGRDLAERLRSSFPGMRVLYMSGYADAAGPPSDPTAARHSFLQKPFKTDSLLRKVREVLDVVKV
jgi:two-component system, cell cycle sensor histidine kinase and response regulator CckA